MAPEALGPGALGGGPLPRAELIAAGLEELRLGDVLERDVEAVDPGHRLLGGVVVGVPVPARLGQEVAPAHRHRVAADDRPDALALEHEPEGVLGVPVLGGVLARHQVLDRGPQRRGGERPAGQARVGERDRPALAAAADRDELARPGGEGPQRVPAPQVRQRLRPRVGGHQVADLGPERDQQLPLEPPVELLEGRGHRRLVRATDTAFRWTGEAKSNEVVMLSVNAPGWALGHAGVRKILLVRTGRPVGRDAGKGAGTAVAGGAELRVRSGKSWC